MCYKMTAEAISINITNWRWLEVEFTYFLATGGQGAEPTTDECILK